MEVSITQFRRKIFELVSQAMGGGEVWVTHKRRRFRIVPDGVPGSRLSRITPLAVINPEVISPEGQGHGYGPSSLQQEMVRAWERDWSAL